MIDVARANILAGTTENKNAIGEIFNIGTGTNHSVIDLVKLIGGKDAKYKHIPQRGGEARETLSDCSKAQNELGWNPEIILEDWIKKNI